MPLYTWLNIVGPALSIIGFSLVSFELYRVQQRDFGAPKTIRTVARFKRRAWRRVASLFQKPDAAPDTLEPKPAYLDLAPAEGHSSTSAILTTGTPLEGRVQTMEIRLARLPTNSQGIGKTRPARWKSCGDTRQRKRRGWNSNFGNKKKESWSSIGSQIAAIVGRIGPPSR